MVCQKIGGLFRNVNLTNAQTEENGIALVFSKCSTYVNNGEIKWSAAAFTDHQLRHKHQS